MRNVPGTAAKNPVQQVADSSVPVLSKFIHRLVGVYPGMAAHTLCGYRQRPTPVRTLRLEESHIEQGASIAKYLVEADTRAVVLLVPAMLCVLAVVSASRSPR